MHIFKRIIASTFVFLTIHVATSFASSFTKLSANGSVLPDTAISWACTRDNVTGLIWEIKTSDLTVRDQTQSLSTAPSPNVYDLLAALNGPVVCGRADWRMPNPSDLFTLAKYDGAAAATGALKVHTAFFPEWNTGGYFAGYPINGTPDRYPGIYLFYPTAASYGYTWPWIGVWDRASARMVAGADINATFAPIAAGDGALVYDPLFNVTMQRCAVGSTFLAGVPSGTCAGTPTLLTYAAAAANSYGAWRLPTIYELSRLYSYSVSGSPWSSTSYEGVTSNILRIAANTGSIEVIDASIATNTAYVNLVTPGNLLNTVSVSLIGSGAGRVTSDVGGFNCNYTSPATSGTCTVSYSPNQTVTLTAAPASGNSFAGWSGACSGTSSTCAVTTSAAKSVTANFAVLPTVSALQPSAARLDVAQTYTITGTGFASATTTVAFDDCPLVASTATAPNPIISATQVTVSCTPQLPGAKRLIVNGVPLANRTVFVDHPTRMGNPASRGVPAINGVSLFNGNFFHAVTDMSVAGRGMPFVLSRSYNSYYWREEAKRGTVDNYKPWRNNWELEVGYVAGTNSKQLYVEQADGSGRSFFQDTDTNWYPIDQGSFDVIKFNDPSSGYFTFYERNGVKQIFETPTVVTPGRLKFVRDHAGNQLAVQHDAATRLVASVIDTVGRSFDFTYYPTGDAQGRANLLKRVQNSAATALHPAGWFVEYDWFADTAPETGLPRARLKTVSDLRRQTWTYNYVTKAAEPTYTLSSRVFLASVADPLGNTTLSLSHSIGAFGNWGVDRVDNSESNFWTFAYCAKQANASCGSVTTAVSFENTATPPAASGQGARKARFDVAGRSTAFVDGRNNTIVVTPRVTADLTPSTYRLAGLTTAQQTQLGFPTGYAYTPDNAGNLATRTDALNKQWNAAYTLSNGAQLVAKNLHVPATTTSPLGLVRGFEFDTNTGANTKRTDPGGAFSTALPNSTGQITQTTDQRNKQTDYEYTVSADNVGGANVSRIIMPANAAAARATEEFKYDTLGRVRWRKDALGAVTETEYNEAGQVRFTRKRRTPAGAIERTVEQDYDNAGNVAYRFDARGQRTEYAYDGLNRLKTTTVKANVLLGIAADIVSANTYDAVGRLSKTTNPNLHDSKTGFDAAGNVNSRSNHLNDATVYLYDADNRLQQMTDPDGRVTKYEYDALGRIRFVVTNAGASIYRVERRYDSDGRLANLIEARAVGGRKNETQYAYHDATSPCAICKGRLWKVFDATQTGLASPQPSSTILYDEAGNVTSITDPRGNPTTISYDNLNREISRTYPTTSNNTATEYNLAGQVTRVVATGTEKSRNTYDEFGQLVSTTYAGGAATFTYDNNGNRLTMSDGVGTTGTTYYVYDGLNRLTKITDVYGKLLEFAYDAAGNRTGIKYPNSQWVYYDFDAAERMTTVRPWWASSAAQYTVYKLDKSGRVNGAYGATTLGNGTSLTTAYDTAGRLTSLVNSSPAVPGGIISSHALTLDENGNWVSAATTLPLEVDIYANSTYAMTYDGANRFQSLTVNGAAQSFSYDTAGRMATLMGNTYGYDGRDLLTSVSGATSSSYTYNGSGHRVATTIGGVSKRYVFDPNPANPTLQNVLTETDSAGTLQRHYIYGYGLLAQADASNNVAYYHFDATGNTVAMTNASGLITDAYAYTPYGETTARGPTANPFRFNGKYGVADDGNGHVHMRARTYRSDIARFLSLDSIKGQARSPQSLNEYSFAGNMPLESVDPSGQTYVPSASDANNWRPYAGEPSTRACPMTDYQLLGNADFSPYAGYSQWFHGQLTVYVGKYRAADQLYPECAYDQKRRLVTSTHTMAWCGGSADAWNVAQGTLDAYVRHTFFDAGGIFSLAGAKGFECSRRSGSWGEWLYDYLHTPEPPPEPQSTSGYGSTLPVGGSR